MYEDSVNNHNGNCLVKLTIRIMISYSFKFHPSAWDP